MKKFLLFLWMILFFLDSVESAPNVALGLSNPFLNDLLNKQAPVIRNLVLGSQIPPYCCYVISSLFLVDFKL